MRTSAILLPVLVILALTIGSMQPATPPATIAADTIAPVINPVITAESILVPSLTPEQPSGSQPAAVTKSLFPANNSGNSVWVRIESKGEYAGTVGAQGRLRDVSGTGEHFYQVPAASTDIIDIYLQNLDTSGQLLSVDVFNNGEIIERKSIMTPRGTLIMAVDLKSIQKSDPALQVMSNGSMALQTPMKQDTLNTRQTIAPASIPQVVPLSCNPEKDSKSEGVSISNCVIGMYLPDISGDPRYGLNGLRNSGLSGFSYGKRENTGRDSNDNQGADKYCFKVIHLPRWR